MSASTRIAAVMAIATFVGACGPQGARPTAPGASPAGVASPSTATTNAPVTPEPTSAATPVPASELEISVGDDSRTVRLFVPELEGGDRVQLLVLLHGWREFPTTMEPRVQAGVLAAREKVVIALPPGRDQNWDAVYQSGDPDAESKDVVFVAGMIDRLVDEYPVDPERVYVGGFSMGAVLADRLGCQEAGRVRAILVVAGSPWHTECDPERPVSALIIHGTTDSTFPVADAGVLATRWRTVDDCSGEPVESAIGTNAVALTNDQCANGSRVELVTVEGQGHVWFRTPDAIQLAWEFFTIVEGQ